jgi:hypothetical protein
MWLVVYVGERRSRRWDTKMGCKIGHNKINVRVYSDKPTSKQTSRKSKKQTGFFTWAESDEAFRQMRCACVRAGGRTCTKSRLV